MVIFYNHINDEGGVPSEIRSFIKLNNYLKIVSSNRELLRLILNRNLKEEIVFVGFFNPFYLFYWFILSILNKKYIVWPIGQISKYSYNKDLFVASPIISEIDLKTEEVQIKKSWVKPIFIFFTKCIFKFSMPKFWVFSDFERKELEYFFGGIISEKKYWVCDNNLKKYNKSINKIESFSRDKITFLCWSRIDIKTKGIDRFYYLHNRLCEFNLKLQSITCGPYYSGDINKYRSKGDWYLLNTLENSYSNVNFCDADFIVLLSRWDGFPRVLREAIVHRIPIIVSQETHFLEIVLEFNVGVLYERNMHSFMKSFKQFQIENADFEGALRKINMNSNL